MKGDYAEFRQGWPVLTTALVGVGIGVTGFANYSFGIVLNPLADAFGWSRTEISSAKTFQVFAIAGIAPFVGMIADRFGVRNLAICSMLAFAISLLALSQMTANIWTYYIGSFMIAAAGCGTSPLVWTRGVATWFVKKRGLALGITTAGSGIAGMLAPIFLGFLMIVYGWQGAYYGMAAVAFLSLLLIVPVFYEKGASKKDKKDPELKQRVYSGMELPDILRSARFWQIAVGFALIGGAISAFNLHLIPMLTDPAIGQPRNVALGIAGVQGLTIILGRLTTGFLVDRFHPPYVAFGFLALPALGALMMTFGHLSVPLLIVAVIFFGLAAGSEIELIPYLNARYFGLKSYGKAYGLIFVLFYAGVGIGPVLYGLGYDMTGNYDWALYGTIPTILIGAGIIAALGKPPVYDDLLH